MSFITSVLLVYVCVVIGLSISLGVGKMHILERICWGWILGVLAVGLVSLVVGMATASWWVICVVVWSVGVFSQWFVWKRRKDLDLQGLKVRSIVQKNIGKSVLTIFICIWFAWLMSNLLVMKDGVLWVAPVHAYGDISLHLSQINSFVYGENFGIANPVLSGEKISYPFLINWITAVVIVMTGFTSWQAIALVGALMGLSVVGIFLGLAHRLEVSWEGGLLALLMIFLSGGLGFVYFLNGWLLDSLNSQFLFHLPLDYTALKNLNYWWINMTLSLFLPQRSFLLGMADVMIILGCLIQLQYKFSNKIFWLVISLTGILPIVHAHSLLVAGFLLGGFGLVQVIGRKFRWSLVIGVVVSAVMVWILGKGFLTQASSPLSTIKVQLGWMSAQENWWMFVLKNFGIYFWVYLLSIIWWSSRNKKELYGMVGTAMGVWWILPMIFRFQPWDYDNTKLFAWWYILSAPLVATFLIWVAKSSRLISIIIVILIVFSGALDMWRLSVGVLLNNPDVRYVSQSSQAIRLGEFIKNNTDPNKTIASIDKFDNPAVVLAGRQAVVGYEGWLWTYGINYSDRMSDLQKILMGSADDRLLDKYNIGYLIVFPDKSNFAIDEQAIAKKYKLIYAENNYEVYKR